MIKIILTFIFNLIFINMVYGQVSIVAVVNGKPITSFELDQKIKLERYLLKNINDTEKRNNKDILNDFIDDKIKIEQAVKMGVLVAKEDELHTKTYFKHFFKLDDDFDVISKKINIDKQILNEKIKSEILWGKLIYGMFASQINVTENDITEKIKEITKGKKEFVYDIVPFVLTDNNQYDAVKGKISQIKACDKFISFAKENGYGTSGIKISIPGNQMDTKLFNAVHNLKINTVSNKINMNGTDTIYYICDKKEVLPIFDQKEKEQMKMAIFQEKLQKLGSDYFNKIKQSASIEIKDVKSGILTLQNKENLCLVDMKK